MKFGKKVSVELIGDAKESYEKLNKIIGYQKALGKTSSDEITLWNGIHRTFDLLVDNPFYGENAKKKELPDYYVKKYDVQNVYIADLPLYWRMVYVLKGSKIEIVCIVLDIFDHYSYNKIFGIRKK